MAVSSQIIATLAAGGGGKTYAAQTDYGKLATLGESGKRYLVYTTFNSVFSLQNGPITHKSAAPSDIVIAIELAN